MVEGPPEQYQNVRFVLTACCCQTGSRASIICVRTACCYMKGYVTRRLFTRQHQKVTDALLPKPNRGRLFPRSSLFLIIFYQYFMHLKRRRKKNEKAMTQWRRWLKHHSDEGLASSSGLNSKWWHGSGVTLMTGSDPLSVPPPFPPPTATRVLHASRGVGVKSLRVIGRDMKFSKCH